MKVEFDNDEAWRLMSLVLNQLVDGAGLSTPDKAKIRRWRSEQMRAGGEDMRALAEKINRDVNAAVAAKRRSAVQKPDWK